VSTLFRRLASFEEQLEVQRDSVWRRLILARIVEEWMTPLQRVSEVLKRVDVLQCKVWLASEYCYCRPEISSATDSYLRAEALRHPLVERLHKQEVYVANDVELGTSEDTKQGILLYGTNAVGKTSFIKSVGLAVLMAQAGMFVAASSFQFRPYRAIYSRILGNDDLFRGMSTFVVEMSELRTLLVEAGPDVLVLGDEVCSGTETESALSIMMATVRLLVSKGTHFLFATHFHELSHWSEMREMSRNVAMKHLEVLYDAAQDRLVYDRRLKEGPGPAIYGLEVAKSLYMPAKMLEDAFRLRERYFPHVRTLLSMEPSRYNRGKIRQPLCEDCGEGVGEEVHHVVPQKDANMQGTLWSPLSRTPFHKNHVANLRTLCSRCHEAIHHANHDESN
jgi:DNA mismatch repair protein MutS